VPLARLPAVEDYPTGHRVNSESSGRSRGPVPCAVSSPLTVSCGRLPPLAMPGTASDVLSVRSMGIAAMSRGRRRRASPIGRFTVANAEGPAETANSPRAGMNGSTHPCPGMASPDRAADFGVRHAVGQSHAPGPGPGCGRQIRTSQTWRPLARSPQPPGRAAMRVPIRCRGCRRQPRPSP